MTATATATRTGWIIEVTSGIHLVSVGRTFYRNSSEQSYGTLMLSEATVYGTRKDARVLKYNETEVVRKVELDELGRATHIIPGR